LVLPPLGMGPQGRTVNGIKFMLYPAGHVLGAAMIQLEIDGVRVLYTGDYSMDEDRHLMQAEAPVDNPPNVLIIESTFGLQKHETREVREKRFLGWLLYRACLSGVVAIFSSPFGSEAVEATVLRGGKVLLPVYALGRAQELMLILGTAVVCFVAVSPCCCEHLSWRAGVLRGVLGRASANAKGSHLLFLENRLEIVGGVQGAYVSACRRGSVDSVNLVVRRHLFRK
jgi:hypothetical protein